MTADGGGNGAGNGGDAARSEEAPAKINLFLHVRGRRADGYHDLETLFAFTRFGDRLHATPAATPAATSTNDWSLGIVGPMAAGLAADDGNLVLRAARAFGRAAAGARPHALRLEKHIPPAAGLGGGSADAAATLRLLNRLHGERFSLAELEELAAPLGADVPACVRARPAIGTGTGARLHQAPALPAFGVLLVNPRVALPTAAVFAGLDGADRGPADALRWHEMRNDLEAAAIALQPAIADVLAFLRRLPGVELARMSGSGATCFALFRGAVPAVAVPRGWWSVATRLG